MFLAGEMRKGGDKGGDPTRHGDYIMMTSYPFTGRNSQGVFFDDKSHFLSDLADIVEVTLVLALPSCRTSELQA